MNENSHDIEDHYKIYLEKVKLKESEMSLVQKIETRQAFYAGVSQFAVLSDHLIRNEGAAQYYEKQTEILAQARAYWKQRAQE